MLFENDLFRRCLEELDAEERAMIRRSAPPEAAGMPVTDDHRRQPATGPDSGSARPDGG